MNGGTVARYVASVGSLILMWNHASGKSSPFTCWILMVENRFNLVGLLAFEIPLLAVTILKVVVYFLASKEMKKMPKGAKRTQFEKYIKV